MKNITLPPLSLYIHYPWCIKKCPYCDFNSHEKGDKNGYIDALLRDLDDDLAYVQNRPIQSIFIGGGTPSLMTPSELSALFSGLKSRLTFDAQIEITLEANPGTFEVEKFAAFKEIGVNRLSIGVQSFYDKHLQSLGRIHDAGEANFACSTAIEIFDNVNIDLMYGLSGQTLDECLADIHQAINLNPSHISFYQLTLEPNTFFAKYPPILPKEDDIWRMGNQGIALLEANGFKRYEVSAFAKIPSKHNLNYWQFGDYIGIGAGAHGKITSLNQTHIFRTSKIKAPKNYLNNAQKSITIIDNSSFEFMLNALRLEGGFEKALFELRTGQSIDKIADKLQIAQNLGLLELSKTRVKPSHKGFDFLNNLQEIFL
jgi:oxygen-independent coproporphyrinogen-3 oxidase